MSHPNLDPWRRYHEFVTGYAKAVHDCFSAGKSPGEDAHIQGLIARKHEMEVQLGIAVIPKRSEVIGSYEAAVLAHKKREAE